MWRSRWISNLNWSPKDIWDKKATKRKDLPTHSRGKLALGKQQLLPTPLDKQAVAAATQHDQVMVLMDSRRKLLDTRPCTCFAWPTFLGEIPPTVEAQCTCLDGKKKKQQSERSASWKAYVKDM
eukprot:5364571-Amphidinium_carterae.5